MKFKADVIGMVNGKVTIVGLVANWLAYFPFHISQTNRCWNTAISKFDREKSKVESMGQSHGKAPSAFWPANSLFFLSILC